MMYRMPATSVYGVEPGTTALHQRQRHNTIIVYHFVSHELIEAVAECRNEDQADMLNTLVRGRRLRDISDLPIDLAT